MRRPQHISEESSHQGGLPMVQSAQPSEQQGLNGMSCLDRQSTVLIFGGPLAGPIAVPLAMQLPKLPRLT